jgi:uncharacterized protein
MPENITPAIAAASSAEIIFSLAGLIVCWRAALRPAARTQTARLAPWSISLSDFLACTIAVIGGGFFFQLLGRAIGEPFLRKYSATDDTRTILYAVATQFGALIGAAGAGIYLRSQRKFANRMDSAAPSDPPRSPAPPLSVSGMLTFLAVLPVAYLSGLIWEQLINSLGMPSELQESVEIFIRLKSHSMFVIFLVTATIIAPVTEELVFRAGLFRYLRTRSPRWVALLVPGLFFALLHVNWDTKNGLGSFAPLTALAVVFSLAYERTGRIGVTMIAHGLFNLNSILLVLAGMRT